ncbi:hypothetical protein FCG67_13215 [Rhodococcus oryzae]|uniref:Glycine zipper family protein n=1 Tax=Rhodococcus oryzae TaxID=2571143 RepID=A0ABY2RK86_9NOCA|nr:hypothetical protein [Rhodococcus oryzae]TJZ77997.1 hypothetical protein FCG67_13215 [Rhodococcus oryzae]
MNPTKSLAASALIVVALGAGAGTAYAQPALPPPGAEAVSDAIWPDNPNKQSAFDAFATEVAVGWGNGGAQGALIGLGVGAGVGCLSIFPNFIAGCIVGGVIGAGVGAVNGIKDSNPKVMPAFDKLLATP